MARDAAAETGSAIRRLAAFVLDVALIALLFFAIAVLADAIGFKRIVPSSPLALSEVTTLDETAHELPDGGTRTEFLHLERVDSFGLWEHFYLVEAVETVRGGDKQIDFTRVLVDPLTLEPRRAVTSNGLTVFLLPWFWLLFEFGRPGSPGRRILGLCVVSAQGGLPSEAQIWRRGLTKAAPFFLIALSETSGAAWAFWPGVVGGIAMVTSFVLVIANPRRLGQHDPWAGTLVVRAG